MRAAVMQPGAKTPVMQDFPDPVATGDQVRVRVTASALTNLTKSRASGAHYSARISGPFVPGVDGTGVTDDGRRVYFAMPEAPFGGLAELTLVDKERLVPIPDALDDVTAAAMANPGMSSWAALTNRARFVAGETVLINGASGSSGRLAIQIARHLGARKIVATARRTEGLRELGADVTISLLQEREALEQELQRQFHDRVDVVLDYLWGESALTALIAAARAGPDGVPIRFIQIGSMSGSDIILPSAVLRSSAIEMLGSGIGSVSVPGLLQAVQGVFEAAPRAGFTIAVKRMPLAQIEAAWQDERSDRRVVITLG